MKKTFDVEIVSHCYAASRPFYLAQLQYQVASLFYFSPPGVRVCLSVCTTSHDHATCNFLQLAKVQLPKYIELNPVLLSPGHLFRRAVGRNLRALAGVAGVYWFTDCDYFFGPGCIQSLVESVDEASGLSYPRTVFINPDHATGDALTDGITPEEKLFPVANPELFVERAQHRCIGGVHIIGRARLQAINEQTGKPFGYINGHKMCVPVDPDDGFRQCRCDLPFKLLHAPAQYVGVKNTYRIRHTTAGRAYDQAGNRIQPMKGDHD